LTKTKRQAAEGIFIVPIGQTLLLMYWYDRNMPKPSHLLITIIGVTFLKEL